MVSGLMQALRTTSGNLQWLLPKRSGSACVYLTCLYRRDVLRESAKQEFELARHEQDPELVSTHADYVVASRYRFATGCYLHLAISCASSMCVELLSLSPQVGRLIVSGRDAVHQVVDKVCILLNISLLDNACHHWSTSLTAVIPMHASELRRPS